MTGVLSDFELYFPRSSPNDYVIQKFKDFRYPTTKLYCSSFTLSFWVYPVRKYRDSALVTLLEGAAMAKRLEVKLVHYKSTSDHILKLVVRFGTQRLKE